MNKNAEASLEDVALRLYIILARDTKSEAELRAKIEQVIEELYEKARRAGLRLGWAPW